MGNPSSNARPTERERSAHGTPDTLSCTFCGGLLGNNAKENVVHDHEPNPFDEGVGLCRRCGGDPEAKTPEERVGYAMAALVRARVPLIAKRLSPKNRARFLAMPLDNQWQIVAGLLERGVLRW